MDHHAAHTPVSPSPSQDPALAGQATAAPLPPSGTVIGDSRIYSGPRRYGWRRHAYPDPPPAAGRPAPAQGPTGSARFGRWRGWRRASQGGVAQAAAGAGGEDSDDVPARGQSPPVVAVPALVDGVPSDGASDSLSGGGAAGNAAGNTSSGDLVSISVTDPEAGDVQLMTRRPAEERGHTADALPDTEAAVSLRHLQWLRLQRVVSQPGPAGSDSAMRIGRDVIVGQHVHVALPEAGSDIEAPPMRASAL